MSIKQMPWLLLAACLFLPVTATAQPSDSSIEFENCTLEMPGTVLTAEARCGWLEVAEDPAKPDGKLIRLHVAMAPAVTQEPEPDPLFLFAGGPGQAASEAYVLVRGVLEKVRRKRDIVMIDQRGTGKSNRMMCQPEEVDFTSVTDIDEIRESAASCLNSIDADPRFYTTAIGMDDYDKVRQALGYEQINLVGISYGTRAAQVYLRQFPDHVRSMILDSVIPAQLVLGTEHALRLDEAVSRVLAACAQQQPCNERFPDSQQNLRGLLEELRAEPRLISITHPVTGLPEPILMNSDVLSAAIRFLSYSSETQAMLPLLIHEAATVGDYSRIASQALIVISRISDSMAHGMELSVICSEDYPFMDMQADAADTLMGNIFMEALSAQCEVWPRGEVAADFHEPKAFPVPVLLLSGEYDPVTPPLYADQAAEQYENSLHLVATGQGHNVIGRPCIRNIAQEFIARQNKAISVFR
jgi:pimeloyl-ACP methyl ester carboxylesterase